MCVRQPTSVALMNSCLWNYLIGCVCVCVCARVRVCETTNLCGFNEILPVKLSNWVVCVCVCVRQPTNCELPRRWACALLAYLPKGPKDTSDLANIAPRVRSRTYEHLLSKLIIYSVHNQTGQSSPEKQMREEGKERCIFDYWLEELAHLILGTVKSKSIG